jgi:hypothetical protein
MERKGTSRTGKRMGRKQARGGQWRGKKEVLKKEKKNNLLHERNEDRGCRSINFLSRSCPDQKLSGSEAVRIRSCPDQKLSRSGIWYIPLCAR